MTKRLPVQRLQRIFAAWIALGYCCLSLLVPFHQHLHQHPNGSVQNTAQTGATPGAQHLSGTLSATLSVTLSAAPTVSPCAACEWEAAITAPALPAFVLSLEMPSATPIVTLLPRAHRAYTFSPSSRGPPQV